MKIDSQYFVTKITVENWEDFEGLFRICGPVVFRGQGDSSWELTTNYERNFQTNACRESSMLKRCISEGHLYVKNPPLSNDYVSWLAEMQHYGASTRLLDVTRSKFIALFFAVNENKDKDGAVWAFDTVCSDNALYEKLKSKMSVIQSDVGDGNGLNDGILPYQDSGWKIANAVIGCEPVGKNFVVDEELSDCNELLRWLYNAGLVLHLVPKRMNRRMLAQQGEFLFPFNIKKTFVDNLLGEVRKSDCDVELSEFGNGEIRCKAKSTTTPRVVKVIIPQVLKEDFKNHLLEMNISYQTLFPDVEGFMKSLQHQRDRTRKIVTSKAKSGEVVFSLNEFEL